MAFRRERGFDSGGRYVDESTEYWRLIMCLLLPPIMNSIYPFLTYNGIGLF